MAVGDAAHPVNGLLKWSSLNAGSWATVDVAPMEVEVLAERSVSLKATEALSCKEGHAEGLMAGEVTTVDVESVGPAAVEPFLEAIALGRTGAWTRACGVSSWDEALTKSVAMCLLQT